MMRADYACSGSEDEATKGCLAKGYFQDRDKGFKGVDLKEVKIAVTRDIPQR